MGAALATVVTHVVFTHVVSFWPERGHVYSVNNNNGTFLSVVDNTDGFTVLHEWIPLGCATSPSVTRTLDKGVRLEFYCEDFGELVLV